MWWRFDGEHVHVGVVGLGRGFVSPRSPSATTEAGEGDSGGQRWFWGSSWQVGSAVDLDSGVAPADAHGRLASEAREVVVQFSCG